MRFGNAEYRGRSWLGGRLQLFGRIVFLVAGYLLLSPACCREGLKWLRTVLEGASPTWLAEAARRLASPDSPVGVLLRMLPAAVSAAVLAGAAVCVCGLFVEWRRERTCFVLAMGTAAAAAMLFKWGEVAGMAQAAETWFWPLLHEIGAVAAACRPYVEALYAGMCLILLAGWMASLLYKWMKNGGVRATGLAGLVVAGCVLYEMLDRQGVFENQFRQERWVRPVQVLDQVFGVLDKPKDGAHLDKLHPGLAAAYYLFHAMLFFFGALVVAGAVSKPLVNTILLRFMRTPDCVFWGVSPEALALARSLSEKRKGGKGRRLECVFAVEDAGAVEGTELARTDFLWVVEGREKPSIAVRRARRHFFLAEDGSANVAAAGRLARVSRGRFAREGHSNGPGGARLAEKLRGTWKLLHPPKKNADSTRSVENCRREPWIDPPEVWVRIDDEADDSWLHRWADHPDIQAALDVHVVRETSLAADLLLQKHPMLEAPGVSCEDGTAFMVKNGDAKTKAAFRMLLVGFGWQGRMILNRTICDAQAPGTTFEADVVDRDASAMELYALRNSDAMSVYNIHHVKRDAAGGAFYGWLDGHLAHWKGITRIVVATGDDALNLDIAMHIDRFLRGQGNGEWADESRERLFVRVRHPENFAGLGTGTETPPFTAFGSLEEIYSREALLDSDTDRIARLMNARWAVKGDRLPSDRKAREQWRTADFFSRESSRASAMGVANLWRLSGLSGLGKPEDRDQVWRTTVAEGSELEKRLADAEHLRWMAFHYVRGVRRWNPAVQPDLWKFAREGVKANLRKTANRHAALVPSADMPALELWLERTYWENRAEELRNWQKEEAQKPGERASAAVLRTAEKLVELFGEYAKDVAARWLPEDCRADRTLCYRNKCVRVGELWWKARTKLQGSSLETAVAEKVAAFVEKDAVLEGVVPPPSRRMTWPTAATIQIPRWKRWFAVWKDYDAWVAYGNFLSDADHLFVREDGTPDMRFRTPGDLVDNDLQIVRKVPWYLPMAQNG